MPFYCWYPWVSTTPLFPGNDRGGFKLKKRISELRGKYRCQAGATCRQECRAAIGSSPPPAHAGVALSSLPTMLINWLGCQFKHSKSAFWGQCYDPGSETNILNFLKVIINFRILIQIYLSLDPDPTETEMRPKHALLIQIDCPLDLDLGFLLKPYADVNPGFVTRPRSFISKPI